MTDDRQVFIIGRREWIALPELGLPALKAKVDTGARTSALHASAIEEIGSPLAPRVRFVVHPLLEHPDIAVACEAEVIDRREIMSSNGERESRYIIATVLAIGPRSWTIEIGLTNREALAHRMLLGRQALTPDMLVDPAATFLQPRLSARLYVRRAR